MAGAISPMTPPTLQVINQQLAALNNLRNDLDRAKRAMVPLDGHCEQCDELAKRWQAIKSEYYPGEA